MGAWGKRPFPDFTERNGWVKMPQNSDEEFAQRRKSVMKNIMVTGGAGFIGSNFVLYMLDKYPDYNIVVYDKLTYAGNLDNLLAVSDEPRYRFVKGDICDGPTVEETIKKYDIDTIVNFAAETHVDRSILNPDAFIQTGVYGTYVLLEAARKLGLERYHQISSVTGDTPILVQDIQTAEIALRPIEWLDGKDIAGYRVLTMTDEYKVAFRQMRHFIKHPADDVYEIRYNGGGTVRATASHSIFVFDAGKVVTKATSDLKVGDLLVTFVGEAEFAREPHVFDLKKLLADYGYEGIDWALGKQGTVLQALAGSPMRYGELKTAVNDTISTSHSFRVAEQLAADGFLTKTEHGIYSVTSSSLAHAVETAEARRWQLVRRKLHIPHDEIEVTPTLMEVFGLYLAEGHASHTPAEMAQNNRMVTFTIGRHEEEKVGLLADCAENIFGIKPYVQYRDSSIQISYSSYWVHAIFSQFGATAYTKQLPAWIWTQPSAFIQAFFKGYEGDAAIKEDGRRIYTTVNQLLAENLVWLARLNNINCLLSTRMVQQIENQVPPNMTQTRQRKFYDLQVTAEHYRAENGRWRTPMARCLPTETFVKPFNQRQNKGVTVGYKQLVGKEKAAEFVATFPDAPAHVQNLLQSPIGVAKIKEIKRLEGEVMVYDVAVPANERFFGGDVPILLHNTDEVYGHIPEGQSSVEGDKVDPRSPYSASKAGADLMVNAYHITYGLPVTITRGSNNIGPFQYPEKVVPLFATNAIDGKPLPVYGDGRQMREYQYVVDHCEAIDLVLHKGTLGDIYNVGTGVEMENMTMVEVLLDTLGKSRDLIRHVADRPGHDRRYSLNIGKIRALGWQPRHTPAEAVAKTAVWYRDNEWWWRKVRNRDFDAYYEQQYGERLKGK